ncbi:MAG: hypothetical protein R3222_02425 [Balneolaceae bacterium]|nr:hypothetical protein [Balneolaceae bacterium]
MIELDIDLNVSGPGGSISINQAGTAAIELDMSNQAIFRETIRNYDNLKTILPLDLDPSLLGDYTFFIQVDSKTVAHLKEGKLYKGRKLYLLYQYVLAKLGF